MLQIGKLARFAIIIIRYADDSRACDIIIYDHHRIISFAILHGCKLESRKAVAASILRCTHSNLSNGLCVLIAYPDFFLSVAYLVKRQFCLRDHTILHNVGIAVAIAILRVINTFSYHTLNHPLGLITRTFTERSEQ